MVGVWTTKRNIIHTWWTGDFQKGLDFSFLFGFFWIPCVHLVWTIGEVWQIWPLGPGRGQAIFRMSNLNPSLFCRCNSSIHQLCYFYAFTTHSVHRILNPLPYSDYQFSVCVKQAVPLWLEDWHCATRGEILEPVKDKGESEGTFQECFQ